VLGALVEQPECERVAVELVGDQVATEQRQGRASAPDDQALPRQAGSASDHRRAPDPAGCVQGLLQRCPAHRAIARRTPSEAFAARPKAAPSLPTLPVPAHVRLRRDKVDIVGRITLRHDSRLHHIGLGRRFVGIRVLVLVDGLRIRVITEDGQLIRELTLDPTRDYQPHGRT
jgi:hypothetical protein